MKSDMVIIQRKQWPNRSFQYGGVVFANETGNPRNCHNRTGSPQSLILQENRKSKNVINSHHHPHWTMLRNGKKSWVERKKVCNMVKGYFPPQQTKTAFVLDLLLGCSWAGNSTWCRHRAAVLGTEFLHRVFCGVRTFLGVFEFTLYLAVFS